MQDFTSHYVQAMGYEIHVRVWGDADNPPLILWHGMLRNGADFTTLAHALQAEYRIYCPDTLGRGLSQWSNNPVEDYALPFYAAIAQDILAHFAVDTLRWVGTSMGGLLGILLAGGPLNDRISHLIINDIGPVVPKDEITRIRSYGVDLPVFETLSEAEAWFRIAYAPFGVLTNMEWQKLTQASMRRRDDGKITVHYDPRVMDNFVADSPDFDLWEEYTAITANTVVLRGQTSNLLTVELAEEMQSRGPKAKVHTIPGCGHAPALNTDTQIRLIQGLLKESPR